ncbi:MAG TPA: MATE family efflux transporter, partial [Pseudomonadaceae bacterium]|nr:MATE family efflux transporter [Pseudomonadaceae bacterium]
MNSSGNRTRKTDLIRDPVGPTLFRSTVPTTVGAGAMVLYYLADTWFIGLLGTDELAALGFTFPATILVSYFGVGLGIGTSALAGKALGSNDTEEAARITLASMLFALLVGLALIIPAQSAIGWLFPMLGADPEGMVLIDQFMSVWILGIPLLLMQFSGTAVIRASGNARLHGSVMVAGAVLNAVLDPLFIFGWGPVPAMGLAGAALATVLAWLFTVVLICHNLALRERLLLLRLPPLHELLGTWRKLLHICLPASLANMITPVSTGVLTATVASYGPAAVAAYGVISRIESFIMLVVLGMSMSLPPFISQNYGARRFDRVSEGLRSSLRFVLILQLTLYALVALAAPWIAAV